MASPQELLAAVAAIRPTLPTLLGDQWPEFERDLLSFLQEIEQADDDDLRQELIDELQILFFDFPTADNALQAAIAVKSARPAAIPTVRHAAPASTPETEAGQTVVRYTDIACPEQVWIHAERVPVVVRLALEPSDLSRDTQQLSLRSDLPVTVLVTADNFHVLNGRRREMTIYPDRDSEIVVDLKPLAVGPARISFDFVQGGNPVGTAGVRVDIAAEPVSQRGDAQLERVLRFDSGVAPPDLLLYVALEQQDGLAHLVYTLFQAGREHGQRFPAVPLRANPREYARSLYRTLDGMILSDESAAALLEEIKEIGQNLWNDLIPAGLRQLYFENQDKWAGKHLLLLSDEPYIPWELIWPFDMRTGKDDEGPWAQTLNLMRWLRGDALSAGYDGPAAQLTMTSVACLAPGDTNLASVAAERAYIRSAIEQLKLRDTTPTPLGKAAVLDLLARGDYSWLHVASHGEYSESASEQDAVIWLEGREYLAPQNLIGGKIMGNIYRSRPGFVFNTCYGSRQAWALTRLGGWANRLIGAGAGLFLAPMWTVRDDLASAFSEAFYDSLLRGKTAAESLQSGRLAAKQSGNPTWLAYSLYAHPNARIVGPGTLSGNAG